MAVQTQTVTAVAVTSITGISQDCPPKPSGLGYAALTGAVTTPAPIAAPIAAPTVVATAVTAEAKGAAQGSVYSGYRSTATLEPAEPQNTGHGCSTSTSNKWFKVPSLAWQFTRSNFSTFVVPNTAFGVLGGLVPAFTKGPGPPPTVYDVLVLRLPVLLAFNWWNVLVFDLGNQRAPESVTEDILNKPWRPIPTGQVTPKQARRALLCLIPVTMLLNWCLGVWDQAVLIPILSYLYNDLGGGDEVLRDPIISCAYAVANTASLRIAVGTRVGDAGQVTGEALRWVAIISGVILTTMQVQDLKDKAGDRTRGRQTIALLVGDGFSRGCIAVFVAFWSVVCARFWGVGWLVFALLPGGFGLHVVQRVLLRRNPADDSRTWKWWCLWTVTLYMLPVCAALGDVLTINSP